MQELTLVCGGLGGFGGGGGGKGGRWSGADGWGRLSMTPDAPARMHIDTRHVLEQWAAARGIHNLGNQDCQWQLYIRPAVLPTGDHKKKYKGKIITLYMKVEEQYHLDSSSLFITAKEISLAAVAAITKQLTKPIIMKERY